MIQEALILRRMNTKDLKAHPLPGIGFLDSVKKMPLLELPVRSFFVPLVGARVLISPGSNLSVNQLKTLNEVTDIVAPSLLHCAGIPKAKEVFPQAKVWGPPGARREKTEMPWDEELSSASWPYQDELPMIEIKGAPAMNECVFVHQKSKTLILCDLCFNLTRPEGIGAWLLLHLMGTYKKFAVSNLTMQVVKDKEAFRQSVSEIFKYDFENIVVSHGESVQGNGQSILRQAFARQGIHI